MDRLISNTEFGFYLRGKEINPYKYTELRENYDSFLKQPLTLGMFVPCKLVDGVWIVLEEPVYINPSNMYYNSDYVKEYQEAKDRVLFEGFNVIDNSHFKTCELSISNSDKVIAFKRKLAFGNDWFFVNDAKVIEDFLRYNYNLELTPTAQKQI